MSKTKKVLARLYSRTRAALDGSPRQRAIVLQEGVDGTIDDLNDLVRAGSVVELDALLSGMDVDKVHPEILDVISSMLDGMSVPSLEGFLGRVSGRLEQVDEILKPIKLLDTAGKVMSEDVRKDAREIYRRRAKEFGDALRADGNLDKFYRSKAGRTEPQDGDMSLSRDGDGFKLMKS